MTDLLIFSGQSNMQGQSECLLAHPPVENAWEYRYLTDSLVPLCDPVGEDIRPGMCAGYAPTPGNEGEWGKEHLLGSACYGHTNLVPAFVRAYMAETGHSVLAVHVAKGATRITQWQPGEETYEAMRQKVSAALKKVPEVGHIAFIWLQGESDALVAMPEADYLAGLKNLWAALQRDLGVQTFGMIQVGYFADQASWVQLGENPKQYDERIMRAQEVFCAEEPHCPMLTRLAPEMSHQKEWLNPDVGGHFSAAGLERLGAAAGKALGAALHNA